MRNLFSNNLSKVLLVFAVVFGLSSCDEGDTIIITPENNTISGKVTFVESNFITSGGIYDIGVFPNWRNGVKWKGIVHDPGEDLDAEGT